MLIRSLFGAGVIAACSLSMALAQPTTSPDNRPSVEAPFSAISRLPVPADPALRTGTLSNGMRYALMRPARATGAVSIRLGFDVGSFEEADTERGLAHFVEHQAFRSTRNFPNNTVEGAFAVEGLTFGRDHNAATDLFSTTFSIDLSRPDPAVVERAFTWLRDVADGVVFEAAAVEKERGVVLAEKQERDSVGQMTRAATNRFRMGPLRMTERDPIGLESVLRNATPAALEAFYRRWYRPEHAVLVVVSDLPEPALKAEIERMFGSWRAAGPAPNRASYGTPDVTRRLDVMTRSDGTSLTSVDVCRLRPAERNPPQDFAQARREALTLIWRDILNERLGQRRQVAESHILGAEAEEATDNRNAAMACLSIKPTNDAWAPALAAGQAELERFLAQGPTELEVERAIDRVRSHLRGAVGVAPSRPAATLADAVVESILDGMVFVEPRQAIRAYNLAVEDVTAADVHAALKTDWSGAGPLITVVAPKAPDAAAVRLAWSAPAASAVAAIPYSEPSKAADWAYAGAPAGVVASREVVAKGDFVRIRFRNGVVMNFKGTRFSQSKAVFLAQFGGGRRQISERDLLVATLGGAIMPFGGLGKHSYDETVRIMEVGIRDLALKIGTDGFVISADEPVSNLQAKMSVAAAFLLDPGFGPGMNPMLREGIELTYRLTDSTPGLKAEAALSEAVSPGSPTNLPPKANLQSVDNAHVSAVLRPLLTTGPVDVTLVGDLDEDAAVRLVAGTFGALPPRPAAVSGRSDAFFVRYPAQHLPPIQARHGGPGDKAAGSIVWPLYVATPERRREEYAISLLARVFDNELRLRLRGELGKSYSPRVTATMPDHADQGVLVAHFESYPGDLDALTSAARAVARRMAEGEITEEQLTTARAALLATDRQAMETNDRWALTLTRSSVDDQALRDSLDYQDLVGAIRLDEVRAVAGTWLAREPIVVTATSMNAIGTGNAP